MPLNFLHYETQNSLNVQILIQETFIKAVYSLVAPVSGS